MRIDITKKEIFLRNNVDLARRAFELNLPTEKQELTIKARKDLGYSDKTYAGDIRQSLRRIWKNIEIEDGEMIEMVDKKIRDVYGKYKEFSPYMEKLKLSQNRWEKMFSEIWEAVRDTVEEKPKQDDTDLTEK